MAQVTGSFERALAETARVLNVRGRILPSTLEDVTLCAELADRSTVAGESAIPARAGAPGPTAPTASAQGAPRAGGARRGRRRTGRPRAASPDPLDTGALQALTLHGDPRRGAPTGRGGDGGGGAGPGDGAATGGNPIRRVYLEPGAPPAYPEAVRALLDADLVVVGPGSLYTSLLPNLLVGDLARALCWSRAVKVYVCNVATQPGETDGYGVAAHVRAIREHLAAGIGLLPAPGRGRGRRGGAAPPSPTSWSTRTWPRRSRVVGVTRPAVSPEEREALAALGVAVLEADVVDAARPTRHDPQKLARALLGAYARLRQAPGTSAFSAMRAWTGALSPAATQSLSTAGADSGARRR